MLNASVADHSAVIIQRRLPKNIRNRSIDWPKTYWRIKAVHQHSLAASVALESAWVRLEHLQLHYLKYSSIFVHREASRLLDPVEFPLLRLLKRD
jgi:hypothetical protein